MPESPLPNTAEKDNLHPRNLHRQGYDFDLLIKGTPGLKPFVKQNQYGTASVNFGDAEAVKMLNRSLLKQYYGVKHWDIPAGYLCPPIPGRADYVHYMADVLAELNNGIVPMGDNIKVLDVGTGANCVYPLIGHSVYGWQFVGTDIDATAIRSANQIVADNPQIKQDIVIRLQTNAADVFKRVIRQGETFDLTICNPPFHSSWQEAQAGTARKWDNLNKTKSPATALNFGGRNNELWCPGGESTFIRHLIDQSVLFNKNVLWFSTLVSKKDTLIGVYKGLRRVGAADVKTISMSQGQKVSRIVAWTFMDPAQQQSWRNTYWV